ncbi:TetR/AcrR family transcriptional regulator, partial [Acinetobacter baumannii]
AAIQRASKLAHQLLQPTTHPLLH